jgi:hypothetical protein
MITLQNYIIFKDIISDKLIESFNKLDNSTYSDNLINENLLEELLVEAEKDTKNDIEADNIIYIGVEITNCQTLYKTISDIKTDENKGDIEGILSNLEKEYDGILKKVTFKDKKIPDECKITNNINNNIDVLDEIENNSKMGEIIGDLRSLSEKITNTITKLKEKSSDDNVELKDEVKTNDNTKEISDKVAELQKSFDDKVEEVNKFINKSKDKKFKESILDALDGIKGVYEYFFGNIQVNTIKKYINHKDYNRANEYLKSTLEPYTNKQIKQLDELITSIKTELAFAKDKDNDNDNNDTPEEIQKSAENEVKILKEGIIKTIAQKINVNVKDLGKTFINIVQSLRDNGKKDPAQAVENIANNQNSDAMIGINLMLLGGLATKNAQNRAKIIYVYCSLIAKAIEEQKYNKLFEQKPEENNTEEQQ